MIIWERQKSESVTVNCPGPEIPFISIKQWKCWQDLDSGGTDEGRAMLEIMHDVAPEPQNWLFIRANLGQANFAQGIQDLADRGCQVIADDVIYFAEPFFQDGIIAQSVDLAKKKGVAYFSSAGNQSLRSYEYNFQPSDVELLGPGAGTAHNFSAPGDPPRVCPAYIYSARRYIYLFLSMGSVFFFREWCGRIFGSGYLSAGYRWKCCGRRRQ